MYAILKGIKNKPGKIKLHFPNGIRADTIEPEDMTLFKQAGTVSACFAIETSSPRLQKMIRKNLNIEKATRAINASVKAGIYTIGFFMLGFPTETYEEASDTIDFASNSPLHRAMFMLVTPFSGTELAEIVSASLKKRDKFSNPRYVNYFTNALNISAMSDEELHKVFRSAYRRFFLNPKRILGLAIHHPRVLSLPRYAFVTLIKILPRRHNPLNQEHIPHDNMA
jgi:anaerobic magnesium-protoporphyrin IX monomethyl ester cyclase